MTRSISKIRLIAIFCALSLFAVQPGFAATKSVSKLKSAGRTANSIPNTILNGTSAPAKTIGINGDFYIDTKNLNIYGPKKKNAWPLPISLRGAAGTAGSDGKTGAAGVAGADGKTITNTATSSGTAGATGATGLAGATGSNGAVGATGSNGTNGSNGAAGSNGAVGETGVSGSAGPAGPPGPAGGTGERGATGNNGTAGASGVTSVSVGLFTFINPLTGTAGAGAQSHNFGSMLAGKKYLMHLVISGVNSSFEDIGTSLLLEITSTVGVIPITTAYFVSVGKSFNDGTRFTQNISADLVIDGTLVANAFNLYATVTATDDLSTSLTLSGYFSLTEVGSIT
jgi:hypothetical protein